MGLPRKVRIQEQPNSLVVNVWDLQEKRIIFTGTCRQAADLVGTSTHTVYTLAMAKYRYKKKYCFRFVKNND